MTACASPYDEAGCKAAGYQGANTEGDGSGTTPEQCCTGKTWKADETEGQLRMFVVMVLVGLSGYIWNLFNGCNLQGRGKIWMTFVMATLTTFMIITLWFGDVYWDENDGKHYVNGVPFLTKNRPHYLHDPSTTSDDAGEIQNCMATSPDSDLEPLSETQRNLRHFLVAAGIGGLGAYIVSFAKAGSM